MIDDYKRLEVEFDDEVKRLIDFLGLDIEKVDIDGVRQSLFVLIHSYMNVKDIILDELKEVLVATWNRMVGMKPEMEDELNKLKGF